MAGQMGYGLQEPPEQGKVSTYIGYSLLVSVFCCMPFGIVALIYGVITMTRNNAGNFDAAKESSDLAEKWMYAACGAGFLIFVGTIIYRVGSAVTGN